MILRTKILPLIGVYFILGTYGDNVKTLNCESPWEQIHRSCYTINYALMVSWQEAEDTCVDQGGNLMSVTTKNELKKFRPELQKYITSMDRLNWWVGLRRANSSSEWRWLDGGELVTGVVGWAQGAKQTHNCVEFNYQGWLKDANCSDENPFICEQMKVTSPSTTTIIASTPSTTTTTTEATTTTKQIITTDKKTTEDSTRTTEEPTSKTHKPKTDKPTKDAKPTSTSMTDTSKTHKPKTEPTKPTKPTSTSMTEEPTSKTHKPKTDKPSKTTPSSHTKPPKEDHTKDDFIGCYAVNHETTCPPVEGLGISWPRTNAGELVKVACGKGEAKWKCQKNPVVCWKDEPDIKQCTSEEIQQLTLEADRILTTEDNTDIAISFTNDLATSLANDSVSEQDMYQSTKLMATAAKANAKDKKSAKEIVTNVLKCGNGLMAPNKKSTWEKMEKQTKRTVASSLLDSMETVTMEMMKVFTTPGVEKIGSEDDDIAVELHVIDVDQMDSSARGAGNIVYEGRQNTFSIPPVTLKEFSKGGLAKLVFISYNNIATMLTPVTDDESSSDNKVSPAVISEVLSASIEGETNKTLPKNVVFTFKTDDRGGVEGWKQQCSFWNVSLGYTGAWDTRGCGIVSYNDTHATCQCDHLTNFAILLNVHSTKMSDIHAITLSYITYVGIIISIVCLFLSWVTFICLSTVQGERNTIHKHLVFCLFVAEILFLAGIERTNNKIACSVIAGCLHFFFLGSFMWMFMEGIHILFMLVQVFDAAKSRLKYYYIMGYGGPLLTVAVSALVYYEGYGTDKYCWLTTDRWFIWSFAGPVAFILLVNLMILIYALSAVCKHSEYVFSKDKGGNLKGWVQGALALEVLLGLTWVFGYFYISEDAIVVAYLFTIFNSLQGVFIFVFHCLLNKKVRKEYQHFIEYRPTLSGTNTTSKSGGQQNGLPLSPRKRSDFSDINMPRAGSTSA